MHAIRPRGPEYHTYKLMKVSTVKHVASMVAAAPGWNPRWEFAMHGEPTLNPKLHKMVAAVRKYLPKAYILLTINGVPLLWDEEGKEIAERRDARRVLHSKLGRLFESGANTIAIDNYGYLRNKVADPARSFKAKDVVVGEYPGGGASFNPHPRHNGKKLVIVEDISEATSGTHSNITNQGGTAGYPDHSRQSQRCAKPFREIAVRWNGDIAVCCDDWAGWASIGNVNDYENIEDLWQHPRFQAFRKMLYHEGRIMGPCHGCNVRSYRVGLLPDHKGLLEMPAFKKKDKELIQECLDEGVSTPIYPKPNKPWLEPLTLQRKTRKSTG